VDARDLAEGALHGIGYHNDEAHIIADHVIDAAMCGYEYSGLAKILNVPESEHFRLPRRSMKVLRETEVSLAFDGGNNVGMLALFHAAQATIKKTATHGIALVSVTDAWMSGRGAYYVEMIAKTASSRSTLRPARAWWPAAPLRSRRSTTGWRICVLVWAKANGESDASLRAAANAFSMSVSASVILSTQPSAKASAAS
jgi:hypothetical protein